MKYKKNFSELFDQFVELRVRTITSIFMEIECRGQVPPKLADTLCQFIAEFIVRFSLLAPEHPIKTMITTLNLQTSVRNGPIQNFIGRLISEIGLYIRMNRRVGDVFDHIHRFPNSEETEKAMRALKQTLPTDEYKKMRKQISHWELYPEIVFSHKCRDPHVRNKWTLKRKTSSRSILRIPSMANRTNGK